MKKQYTPIIWANGLWNHFTGRKKYHIQCGNCKHTYIDKVDFQTDIASSICPCCSAQNIWSHSGFAEAYNRELIIEDAQIAAKS